jgi:hypothetical protein
MENENLKEPEPQDTETSKRGKSPRNRLLDRVKQLDALAKNKELKLAKLADVQLEAASLERLLYNDARDDRNNELTAQVTAQREEIARLTQANAELKSELQTRTAQREPERIPDDRVQGLQEQVSTLESLLKEVATLARSCDIESRTRHAVSLVIKYERRKELMSAVEGLGVDFSSVAVALQKSETELLGLLQQAQQEGTGTPIWRAVLAVKYQVQVDGHGKQRYHDEVDSESSLYADSL